MTLIRQQPAPFLAHALAHREAFGT
jgi:hypothetical protein